MALIHSLLVLLGCQLAGEVLTRAAGLPIPGPVLGLVILAAVLLLRRAAIPGPLRETSLAILRSLSLLFVPAGVGVVSEAGLLSDNWLAIAVALVASTILTLAVAAAAFRLTVRLLGDSEPPVEGDR